MRIESESAGKYSMNQLEVVCYYFILFLEQRCLHVLLYTVVKINVGQQPVEQVDGFTYLGIIITTDGSCEKDFEGKASAVVGRLETIGRDKNISVATKLQTVRRISYHVSDKMLDLNKKKTSEEY